MNAVTLSMLVKAYHASLTIKSTNISKAKNNAAILLVSQMMK